MKHEGLVLPPALQRGDAIRLVAPAGPFDHDWLAQGIEILEREGFRVLHRPDVFSSHRYMAGDDERRLAELQEAFDEPDTRAIWSIRGGYGTLRILDRLDLSALLERPKIFIGFSDLTAIHSLLNEAGLVTIHGPMAASLWRTGEEAMSALWRLTTDPSLPPPYDFEPLRVIREGRCTGRFLGGNLSLITRLLGTPYQPDFLGTVLLIEEVGEAPYRVDRMLTHLELAGVGGMVAGVVVGELTECEAKGADYTCLDVVEERIRRWGVPAVAGFPVGHGTNNLPVPMGIPASLDAGRGSLVFEMPAVSGR